MGSGTSDQRLTGARVAALRARFAEKFASHPALAAAIESVLGTLDDGWREHDHAQGMQTASLDAVSAALGPALAALDVVVTSDALASLAACDELVRAWRAARGAVAWE